MITVTMANAICITMTYFINRRNICLVALHWMIETVDGLDCSKEFTVLEECFLDELDLLLSL